MTLYDRSFLWMSGRKSAKITFDGMENVSRNQREFHNEMEVTNERLNSSQFDCHWRDVC